MIITRTLSSHPYIDGSVVALHNKAQALKLLEASFFLGRNLVSEL